MARSCIVCREQFPDDSRFCPNCGAAQPDPPAGDDDRTLTFSTPVPTAPTRPQDPASTPPATQERSPASADSPPTEPIKAPSPAFGTPSPYSPPPAGSAPPSPYSPPPAGGAAPPYAPPGYGQSPPGGTPSPYAPPPAGGAAPPYAPPGYGQSPPGGTPSPYPPPGYGQSPAGGTPSPYAPPPAGGAASPYAPPGYGQSPPGGTPYGPPAPTSGSGAPGSAGAPGGYQPYQQAGYQPGQTPYPPGGGYGPPSYPPYGGAAQPPARGNPLARWLIGIGLVLVLIAGGFGLYAAVGDGGATPVPTTIAVVPRPSPTPRPTPTDRPESRPTPTPEDEVEPTPVEAVVPALDGATGDVIYISPDSYNLVSMPASGGDETELAFEDSGPFYSSEGKIAPNGERALLYDRKGNGVEFFVSAGDGSGQRKTAELTATVPYELVWSPDSSKVAFIVSDADSGDNSEQNVFILDAESGELRQLTTQGNVDTSPLAWSLDSGKLVFSVAGETTRLHTINADGSDDRELVESFTFSAGWLPDGRIVYEDFCDETSFERGVCVLDPQSGAVETLLPLGDNTLSGTSPDGAWLMLENYADGSLSLVNTATKDSEVVVPPQTGEDIDFNYWSVWSPDSAYVTYRSSTNYVTYAYRIGSNKPAQPLTSETLIAWVP